MKRSAMMLILLAACAMLRAEEAPAGAKDYDPFYARIGLMSTQGNLRAFGGGRVLSPIYELGYAPAVPEGNVGLGAYASYFKLDGKAIAAYDGLQQDLYGYRFGFDARYATSVPGLTPFVGISWNFYDGERRTAGAFHDSLNGTTYPLAAGAYPEGKGKLGARLGLEYRISPQWGVVLDYSFSEWYSQKYNWTDGTMAPSGPDYANGLNPVRPSWITLSAQYRFNGVF